MQHKRGGIRLDTVAVDLVNNIVGVTILEAVGINRTTLVKRTGKGIVFGRIRPGDARGRRGTNTMLGIIIGIFIVYASGSVHTYHVAVSQFPSSLDSAAAFRVVFQNTNLTCISPVLKIVGFLSTGLVYTTAAVNQLVYAPGGAFEAAGAGFYDTAFYVWGCCAGL